MRLIKGIKKGKTIELLEEIEIPDGQEILIGVQPFETLTLREKRPSGLCEGEFVVPCDFDSPLPEEILQAFEAGA
ncbi:hypothetical protein [Gloeocapsa sp. PCC 73106]|uniref:hypothetical protein n=1 Tax=Gloeocapsa sp. PCC 73106 TaxID=102232 RepID=UPI0002AC687D|nr:hypothetical protein [Gloeocapsa sp. PCC 73106]ELR98872.1 hypothetical protein GLO73106DRAFT_00027100 [Gloeocapsa sp. PCC 73106]